MPPLIDHMLFAEINEDNPMPEEQARHGLELRSLITSEGNLELSLTEVEIPSPRPDQVVIEVRATPINPARGRAD